MALNFGKGLFKTSGGEGEGDDRRKEVKYYNIPFCQFTSRNPDVDNVEYLYTGTKPDSGATEVFYAPVHLPDGAEMIEFIAYGNTAGEQITFIRANVSDMTTRESIIQVNLDGTPGTIPLVARSQVVDNKVWVYYVSSTTLDDADKIYTVVIKYLI